MLAPTHATREELIEAGIRVCSVEGCTGYVVSRGLSAKFGTCRQCHPNRCLGPVKEKTFVLPSDSDAGRCRNLTTDPSGRCWRHRRPALPVETAVELDAVAA